MCQYLTQEDIQVKSVQDRRNPLAVLYIDHERIVLGYVRDYIHLNFMNFPIFNVADIFITIGVIALVAILLFYKGR